MQLKSDRLDDSLNLNSKQKEVSMRFIGLTSICIWLLGIFLWVEPVLAQVSFKGKTVRIVSTGNPGGGTDVAGRLFGRFLAQYLPGKPQIIFQAIPGGGGVKGTNYFYKRAKPDGLSIMNNVDQAVDPNVLQRSVVKYKPLEFEMVGGFNRGGNVLVIRKDAHKRLYDRSAKPVIVAAASGLRTWNSMILWGAEFLGWNVRWVVGYGPSTSAMFRTVRQGEADMTATSTAYLIDPMREDGVADLIAQSGIRIGDKYIARNSYKEVPLFTELLKAKKLKPIEWQGYFAWAGAQQADKWLALPPGTPKKYVRVYRTAFEKVAKDPKFIKLAGKQLSADLRPISGEDLEKLISEVVNTPDEAVNYATELRVKYGLPGKLK